MTTRLGATLIAMLISAPAVADSDDPATIDLAALMPPVVPDPVALEVAGSAGLESPHGPRGLVFMAAIGPTAQVGSGVVQANGGGGGLSVRVADVASARWLVGRELDVTAVARRQADDTV